MTTACTSTSYYSGQGALLLADRDGNGDPTGFLEVGNVSALTLAVETTVFEHKESCSGTRGVDLELTQEINITATITMESLNKENLALALYGTSSIVAAASATAESHVSYHDKWIGMDNIKISTVVVKDVTDVTTYVLDTDYEVNLETGSIRVLSTGSITDLDVLHIDYDFAVQDDVQAITTSSAPQKYARFEGLNTADTDKAIVVELFKMSIQPLAELALINEEISQLEVEAKILLDTTKTAGSQYFTIRKIA